MAYDWISRGQECSSIKPTPTTKLWRQIIRAGNGMNDSNFSLGRLSEIVSLIQQSLPPGATLLIQRPPDPVPTLPVTSSETEPTEQDLLELLNPLSAAEVRILAQCQTDAVTNAIARNDLRVTISKPRRHLIDPKDALTWIENRKLHGHLAHGQLIEIWRLRKKRGRR